MLTTLGELPWWVAPILGLAVGALVFLAGTVADKARMRRWERELEESAPVRPADYYILYPARKQQPECGCLVQTNANGVVCTDEPCDEHKEDDRG